MPGDRIGNEGPTSAYQEFPISRRATPGAARATILRSIDLHQFFSKRTPVVHPLIDTATETLAIVLGYSRAPGRPGALLPVSASQRSPFTCDLRA
jgi:hypothetical protein